MPDVAKLWKKTTTLPVIGEKFGHTLFSAAYSQVAPYFASIRAVVDVLEPNRAELVIKNRRRVRNHIGTVHAIALCNGLEMAMGALAEVTVPKTKRWIPKGMTVTYTAKADGDIRCFASTTAEQWATAEGDLEVAVWGEKADGTKVIDGVITLWVTTKKPK